MPVARLWRGRTAPGNGGAYEQHLEAVTLPRLRRIAGHRAAFVLRRDLGQEVEFVVLTLWDSTDAIRAFAGDDHEIAVIPDEARALLAVFDERAVHYDVALEPDG